MKEKHGSGLIYALADYKQLVLAYKTKHVELVRSLTFWKTSVIWLSAVMVGISGSIFFFLEGTESNLAQSNKNLTLLNNKLKVITIKLDKAERELRQAREELVKKQSLISDLERNMSTTSKKLIEKLLKE